MSITSGCRSATRPSSILEALLTNAIEAFTAADLHLYAAVGRRRLAGLVGGDFADEPS